MSLCWVGKSWNDLPLGLKNIIYLPCCINAHNTLLCIKAPLTKHYSWKINYLGMHACMQWQNAFLDCGQNCRFQISGSGRTTIPMSTKTKYIEKSRPRLLLLFFKLLFSRQNVMPPKCSSVNMSVAFLLLV